MLVKLGGACDLLLASQEAQPDPRVFLDYHPIAGLYMPNGCMACSGSLLNWFAAHFGAAADARTGTDPREVQDLGSSAQLRTIVDDGRWMNQHGWDSRHATPGSPPRIRHAFPMARS
jgi:xylulokinase